MLTQDTVQLQGLWCDEANYELPRFFVRKYSKRDMLTLSATLAGPREMKSPASLQCNGCSSARFVNNQGHISEPLTVVVAYL